ncbi:MAG: saccharopine dehydrogenase NADP-binding domain-containing protein [Candidatus Alcyoniella australis]|nr:saccharopine dehydrogenase NADP-binding domain-containing protein [Candidatus Alcyoniella australis]
MKKIAVLGATGYTGELVVKQAAAQGLALIIGGRDQGRLEELNAECNGLHEVRTADVGDPQSIDALIADAAVLIDTAGPFIDLGPPVIQRCIESGVHFLDTTGEQRYMLEVFQRFFDEATQRKVSVIPSMAFEYSLGDCAAALAAQRLPDVDEIDMFYYVPGFSTSRGTKLSALKVFGGETFCFLDGELTPQVPGAAEQRVAFLDQEGLHSALSFPGGEPVLLPRHIALRDVRNWMVMKPKAARLFQPADESSGRTPMLAMIERSLKSNKRGPTLSERQAARFKVLVRGTSPSGTVACQVWGSDVYLLTAQIILYGAKRLLAEDLPRGALTPSQAFGAGRMLDDLRPYGVQTVCEGP